jgi:hypothetical protein
MGLDLTNIIPSILFGFLVAGIFAASITEQAQIFPNGMNATYSGFDVNNSLNTARLLTTTAENSTTSILAYIPGIDTMFKMWDITKAGFEDIGQALNNLISYLGGDETLVLLKTIIMTCIGLAVAWIIMMAFFKVGGFRKN